MFKYDFSNLSGTVEVATEHELPTFSHESFFEARAAGHCSIKCIRMVSKRGQFTTAKNLYEVEFFTGLFDEEELGLYLNKVAERYAKQQKQALEPEPLEV